MADNVLVTEGVGTTIGADEISSVKYQRVKVIIGADGVNDGDVASGNPLPVTASALPLPTGAATAAKQLPDGHNVVVTSAPTTAVTGTFWQATQPVSGPVTDTQLRATPVPVDLGANNDVTVTGTVDLGATDNAVLDAMVVDLAALEVLATSIDADTDAIKTAVEVIDNAISGSEMQVDVVTLPAVSGAVTANPSKLATTDDADFVRKYYTNAGAVTDGIIWSPAAGKRWYITDLIINTSAAAVVTIEDDLTAGDAPVLKLDLAANGGMVCNFKTPLASGEDAADLLITTTAGNIYVSCVGYEI